MNIKRLDSVSVSKICVNQVVVDLPMCIKELVENSIDAGATKVDITFYDHGSTAIRVSDNGSGINVENFDSFTKKGATSKIGDFEDISKLLTYGFRGEALNAISRLSEMKITTKTANDENGWELSFDNEFNLVSTKDVNKAEVGTDIYLQNLFRNLPVRYQEFKSNYKHQFTNAVSLLENYALISTEAKITVINSTKEKPWDVILSNNGPNPRIKENILSILGKKTLDTLGEVKLENDYFKMDGYATKTITSGSMKSMYKKDMIYFFVNKRPVNLSKKFTLLLGQLYRQHNPNAKYVVILNVTISPEEYDINISPDKKEIVFKRPNTIYDEFKKFFEGFLEEQKACSKMLVEPQTQQKLDFKRLSATSQMLTEKKANSDFKMTETQASSVPVTTKKRKFYDDEPSEEQEEILKRVKLSDPVDIQNFQTTRRSMTLQSNDSFSSRSTEKERNDLRKSLKEEQPKSLNMVYQNFKSLQQRFSRQGSQRSDTRIETPKYEEKVSEDNVEISEEEEENKVEVPSYKITELKFNTFNLPKIEVPKESKEVGRQDSMKGQLTKIVISPPQKKKQKEEEEEVFLEEESSGEDQSGGHDAIEEEEEDNEEKSHHSHSHCSGHKDPSKKTPASQEFVSNMKTLKITEISANSFSQSTQSPPSMSSKSSVKKVVKSSSQSQSKDPKETSAESDEIGKSESQETAVTATQKAGDEFIDKMIENVAKTFKKNQFLSLFLVGQFNLGFIVCLLPDANEIYVIDQHAADEKFNFERFMKETKMATQHLIQPLEITLPQTHLLLLRENLDIVEKNGFKVKSFKDAEGEDVLKITALPMIKNKHFNEDDLMDLLNLIEANPYEKNAARIPKIKNVIASKACRASVMVGDALNKQEMNHVVSNLATLKSPWNCPHGRPTLITLGGLDKKISQIHKAKPKRPFNLKNLCGRNSVIQASEKGIGEEIESLFLTTVCI